MEDGDGLSRLFEVSRTLPRGPEAVYAALVDPAARRAWSPGLEGVEPDDAAGVGDGREAGAGAAAEDGAMDVEHAGAAAQLGAGAAWTETRRLFDHLETEHLTVSEARPAERLVLTVDGDRGSSRSGTYRYTWTLTPEAGGTRVSVACDAGDLSRKGAILVRFLIGPFQRVTEEELGALERWLEARD